MFRDVCGRKRRLTTIPDSTNWVTLRNYWAFTVPYNGYNPTPYPGTTVTSDNPMPPEWYNALMSECVKYLGYPYVAGGKTPSTSFDCSGFVGYCCKVVGIIPDSVISYTYTLRQYCSLVPNGEEAPGDLCFWARNPGPSEGMGAHVAIYIGNGWEIDASGGGVAYRQVSVHSTPFLGYYRIPRPYPGEV